MTSDRYPMSSDSLRPAVRAAAGMVTPDRLGVACASADGAARLLVDIVREVAPHIGAAALLDYADELHDVCEPATADPLEWADFHRARNLRERACRLVNWDTVSELREYVVQVVRQVPAG